MTSPAASVGILDRQKALDRIDGDQELLNMLCAQFLTDLPALMEATGVGRSLDDTVRALHTLKSCAAAIGADRLAALAHQSELALREGRRLDREELAMVVHQTVRALTGSDFHRPCP